jgi:hypothetical protein
MNHLLTMTVLLCLGCNQLEPKAQVVAKACDAAIRYNKIELRRYFGVVANRFERPAPAVPEIVATITKHSRCRGYTVKGNNVSLEVEALDIPKIFTTSLKRVFDESVVLGLSGKSNEGNELIRRAVIGKLREANLPRLTHKILVKVQQSGEFLTMDTASRVLLFTRVTGGLPTALGVKFLYARR